MVDLEAPTAHLVLRGNPVDGLTFYGPFIDSDAATRWGRTATVLVGHTWWVGRLAKGYGAAKGHVLVTGKPGEGFKFYGPFATAHDANLYGLAHFDRNGWWVRPLESPEPE